MQKSKLDQSINLIQLFKKITTKTRRHHESSRLKSASDLTVKELYKKKCFRCCSRVRSTDGTRLRNARKLRKTGTGCSVTVFIIISIVELRMQRYRQLQLQRFYLNYAVICNFIQHQIYATLSKGQM